MKHGEQFPPADAQALIRMTKVLALAPAALEENLITWLVARYDEVWKEGHAEGRLDAMTGGDSTRSPYR